MPISLPSFSLAPLMKPNGFTYWWIGNRNSL